ncbi:uncharacterized protein TNCV_2109491 [Trichonephila clavipes]|nr:uncharacterized protein TNCV_2109491 [Trichonephila clavipes]
MLSWPGNCPDLDPIENLWHRLKPLVRMRYPRRLNESDCEKSEESADAIDNIPENPGTYVVRDDTEGIPHNSNAPGKFATRNVLRPSSVPTSFAKHNVNVVTLSFSLQIWNTSPNLELRAKSGIRGQIWETVNPDDPDEDNRAKL